MEEDAGKARVSDAAGGEPTGAFSLTPDTVSEAVGVLPRPEKVAAPASAGRRAYLVAEMVCLFAVVPTLYWKKVIPIGVIPGICVFAVLCLTLLLTDRTFDRRSLWRWSGVKKDLKRILLQWAVFGPCMALGVWLTAPERLFAFPRDNTVFFFIVIFAYPIGSVYGQELIFRVFFFHRYEHLLTRGWMRVLGSATAFGYAHILFAVNPWVSIVLSGLGGVLFAWTYERTRSCAAAGLEHALYGDTVWTVGLGQFFYAGALKG